MAERKTKYLFEPYQNNIHVMENNIIKKVKINDGKEVCRVMVNGKMVYERHNNYSIDPIPTEKNGKENGTHTGRCRSCNSIQIEPHSWVGPYYYNKDKHRYLCSRFSTSGIRCSGFYLKDHSYKSYKKIYDKKGIFDTRNHEVTCGVCGGSWSENHTWSNWYPIYDENNENWEINKFYHEKNCSFCGGKESEKHKKSYSYANIAFHTVKCEICGGSWLEGHQWEMKEDGTMENWRYSREDSKSKTHHRVRCTICRDFKYEVHNYGRVYTKSSSGFKGECFCGKSSDSITKWSIGYGSVPCGNGNFMDIQLEYNIKNNKLRFKILDGEYPLVYMGNGKVPDEKGVIHVGDGWYQRAGGKEWESGYRKTYKYKKYFALLGAEGRKGGVFEGTPSKGYTFVVDYQAYCSIDGMSNQEFSYSVPMWSNSKTKIDTKNPAASDGFCRFYRGGFIGFWQLSNEIRSFPYIIFPYKKGWHQGEKILVNATNKNKKCTINVY